MSNQMNDYPFYLDGSLATVHYDGEIDAPMQDLLKYLTHVGHINGGEHLVDLVTSGKELLVYKIRPEQAGAFDSMADMLHGYCVIHSRGKDENDTGSLYIITYASNGPKVESIFRIMRISPENKGNITMAHNVNTDQNAFNTPDEGLPQVPTEEEELVRDLLYGTEDESMEISDEDEKVSFKDKIHFIKDHLNEFRKKNTIRNFGKGT